MREMLRAYETKARVSKGQKSQQLNVHRNTTQEMNDQLIPSARIYGVIG